MTGRGWWATALSRSSDLTLTRHERELLLDIAEAAIIRGFLGAPPRMPPGAKLPEALRAQVGVFVTLSVGEQLNGCIGSIDGTEELGRRVARHAWSAAFADPRLPRLRRCQYDNLHIEVSVLSPAVPLPAASRHQLLGELRLGLDGLIVAAGSRRGVFLPDVWEQLPDPDAFLGHLLHKAGIPADSWPDEMLAWRFTTEKFGREARKP